MLEETMKRIEEIIDDKQKFTAVLALIDESELTEKSIRSQKQLAGIAAAKERGVQFGRPLMDFPKKFVKIYDKQRSGMLTATEASRTLNISRQQYYRLRQRYEEQNQK